MGLMEEFESWERESYGGEKKLRERGSNWGGWGAGPKRLSLIKKNFVKSHHLAHTHYSSHITNSQPLSLYNHKGCHGSHT